MYGTYVWVGAYEYKYSRRLEEGVRTSGARVTSICESPDMDVRDQTQVLTRTICALNCEPSLQPPKPSFSPNLEWAISDGSEFLATSVSRLN